MGLTWFYSIHDGHVMLGHTGGLPDFANHVCFYPDENVGVCWLSNLQDGSGWRPPAPTVLRMVQGEWPSFASHIQTVPDNWKGICGVYGDDVNQVKLRMQNGYLFIDESMALERIDDARYIAHGLSNDGYEVYFDIGEDNVARSISFSTTYLPRHTPVKPVIDLSLELEGLWKGEYHDSSGFHVLELIIKDEALGSVRGPQGEALDLEDFKATKGKVTGTFRYKLPKEYARWGTSDYADLSLELIAKNGSLYGVLKSRGMAIRVTLTKR